MGELKEMKRRSNFYVDREIEKGDNFYRERSFDGVSNWLEFIYVE